MNSITIISMYKLGNGDTERIHETFSHIQVTGQAGFEHRV